jgi:hypothetical protein
MLVLSPRLLRVLSGSLYRRRSAVTYAVFFIVVFWLAYQLTGMQRHWDMPEYLKGREGSWFTSLYTSIMSQSNAMPDSSPKTTTARVLFLTQVSLGWLWFLLFT